MTDATRDVVIKHALADGKDYGAPVTTADQFRSFVAEINNSFVDWRYCYETGKTGAVSIHPTIVVIKAVDAACRELGAT